MKDKKYRRTIRVIEPLVDADWIVVLIEFLLDSENSLLIIALLMAKIKIGNKIIFILFDFSFGLRDERIMNIIKIPPIKSM